MQFITFNHNLKSLSRFSVIQTVLIVIQVGKLILAKVVKDFSALKQSGAREYYDASDLDGHQSLAQ